MAYESSTKCLGIAYNDTAVYILPPDYYITATVSYLTTLYVNNGLNFRTYTLKVNVSRTQLLYIE